jgi:hypothetical protein
MGQLSFLVRSSVGEEKVLSLTQANGTTISPGRILAAIREAI